MPIPFGIVAMKYTLALFSLLAAGCSAFVPVAPSTAVRRNILQVTAAPKETTATDDGVRNAYDGWRKQYEKGDFDEVRYEAFKENFEAITAANEANTDGPTLSLNEFGDFTAEEYQALQSGEPVAAPGKYLCSASVICSNVGPTSQSIYFTT